MSSAEADLASVKCTFDKQTRVLRVRKDIPYNAFMLKISEEFGLPLVVDTYEDAEGELITLGDNGVIQDLATQLDFGAKHRPYAIKLFLRRAGTKRLSNVLSPPIVTIDRRRSSESADDHARDGVLPSKSFSTALGPTMRRRDSKGLILVNDENNGRRGSLGDQPYIRRSSLVDLHMRHSSAGVEARRSSVDSAEGFDEVSIVGPHWEPPADRLANGEGDMLDYMMSHEFEFGTNGPRPIRPDSSTLNRRDGGFGMHVEIPDNTLHTNTMMRGSIDSSNSSASSALKTPNRVSPMISPFGDTRFPVGPHALGSSTDYSESNNGGMHSFAGGSGTGTVVMIPTRHAGEPNFDLPAQYPTLNSNGSSASDLPLFHQQPFPPPSTPTQFGAFRGSHPVSPASPVTAPWQREPFSIEDDSFGIREHHMHGGALSIRTSDSSDPDIEVEESDLRGGPRYAFVSPTPAGAQAAQNPASSKVTKPVPPQSPSPQDSPRQGSSKMGLRAPMNKAGGRSASSSIGSPKPQNLAWKKGELIGRGGFGSVYKGLLSNGRSVAVKQLELPPDVDPTKSNTYVSFMKEIDMLKNLNHPNIVRYIGSTVEGNTINVFLEFVPGGSIASMISKYGPFEEPLMKLFAKNILEALEYLHKNNIAHRDIKGANILVDDQGVAKLADFGCSKSISVKSTGTGENFLTMLGTPYWMAPEVMRQEGHGRMADIWSFGCVLVEMASGKPPWAKDYTQIFALLYDVGTSTKTPDIPPNVSPELSDLMTQCFRRNPQDRPTAAQLLAHSWFRGIEEEDSMEEDDDDLPSASHTPGSSLNPKKRSNNQFLMRSMGASRSQALRDAPKSLDSLPENVILRVLSALSPQAVTAASRTCAHLRFLAQRNVVWVSLANHQWPKLRIQVDQDAQRDSLSADEADFGKKLFMAYLKYDRRFLADPLYRLVRTLKGHTKKVFAMQFIDGATRLVSCAGDKKIKIWDIASAPTGIAASSSSTGLSSSGSVPKSPSPSGSSSGNSSGGSTSSPTTKKKTKASTTLRGHNASVSAFCASNTTVISGSCDGMVKVWDFKTKKCITTIRTGDQSITGLQFDEKSNYLVTSAVDGVAKVWDLRTFEIKFTLTGHKSGINAMKFHHHLLATASSDNRVKIWDLRTGALVYSLHGHQDEVLSVDIVGDTVIAGAADGALLEWSLGSAQTGAKLRPSAYALPVSLSPSPINAVHFDGVNTVIAGREDGLVVFWRYHTGKYQSSFKADSGAITALAASNQTLATAGYGEKIVKVWALSNPT